jgi:protein SCO1/2
MVAACSSSDASLIGYVPPDTKSVSSVTVTEIVDGAPRQWKMQADDGEILVVMFGYTNCPDICPATLSNLKNAKSKMGDDASRVDIAMVTVDPERDTAEILPRYLSSFTDRFHAVVPASPEELAAAEAAFEASSSVTKVDGRVEVSHTGTAYGVDDTGTVAVEWPFGIDVPSLVNDLTLLLNTKESTQ